jgi:hypothetical protein
MCQEIISALRPGGLLFYQTFIRNKLSSGGPSSDEFLLDPNELLSLFAELHILVYQEEDPRWGNSEQGERNLAALIGARPA